MFCHDQVLDLELMLDIIGIHPILQWNIFIKLPNQKFHCFYWTSSHHPYICFHNWQMPMIDPFRNYPWTTLTSILTKPKEKWHVCNACTMQSCTYTMFYTTTNPIMDVVMDWGLLILCEYDFIHHQCNSWILQLLNFLKKKKYCLNHMFASCIMHYTIYIKYLVIHYIIYHFEFLFI
jgi:hypothetical protein